MRYRYHYSFTQKAMFSSLWMAAGLLVIVNFFSNPLLSVHGEAPTLSIILASVQGLTLITLWCLFSKAFNGGNAALAGYRRHYPAVYCPVGVTFISDVLVRSS
jgi:hypothetical protein